MPIESSPADHTHRTPGWRDRAAGVLLASAAGDALVPGTSSPTRTRRRPSR